MSKLDTGFTSVYHQRMFNSILTAVVTGFITLAGLLLAAGVVYYVSKRKIECFVRGFVESPDKDTASPLAVVVSSIADVFGKSFSANLKATFMGIQSVENKNAARSASAEIVGDNPLLGALATSFPAVGKRMLKNPMMAELVSQALSRFLSHGNAGVAAVSSSPKFNL